MCAFRNEQCPSRWFILQTSIPKKRPVIVQTRGTKPEDAPQEYP